MRIGVDFGGTKIEAAVVADDGTFLARKREPNPGAYEPAIETIAPPTRPPATRRWSRKFSPFWRASPT